VKRLLAILVALTSAALLAALPTARAEARSALDYTTLMTGSYPQPVDFSAFAPDAGASSATRPTSASTISTWR